MVNRSPIRSFKEARFSIVYYPVACEELRSNLTESVKRRMNSPVVTRLQPGREKQIGGGHPWVFSGAIREIDGPAAFGAVTDVLSADGRWLGRGLLHPESAIRVRIYTHQPDQPLDEAFFANKIEQALELRRRLPAPVNTGEANNARRLIFSESDGLSGLIVDQYADVLSIQVNAGVLVPLMEILLKHLGEKTGIRKFFVTCDEDAVRREQIDPAVLQALCSADTDTVRIAENGFAFNVDLREGQKTGFFMDQRVNRQRVAAYCAGRRVLSAYCYTGAFEVYAAAAGAVEITGIDRSEPALERAREHHRLNNTNIPVEYLRTDAPECLRRFRDSGRMFDLIILDPPRFVFNQAQKEKGLRAYKDINLFAMKLLTAGGILATFSCSGLVPLHDFKTMLAWAARDAGRTAKVLEVLSQPSDHPVLTSFPESEYLKGLISYIS